MGGGGRGRRRLDALERASAVKMMDGGFTAVPSLGIRSGTDRVEGKGQFCERWERAAGETDLIDWKKGLNDKQSDSRRDELALRKLTGTEKNDTYSARGCRLLR